MAAPLDYDGPGDAWSPEHLLLAAVESCLLLTFRAIARMSQLPFVGLVVEAVGTVNKQDGVTRFTEIVLRPRLTLPPGANLERAQRILERSERSCLVSASLSTPVRMEATIVEADAALSRQTEPVQSR
jgi:peroxiredoxin-like protein